MEHFQYNQLYCKDLRMHTAAFIYVIPFTTNRHFLMNQTRLYLLLNIFSFSWRQHWHRESVCSCVRGNRRWRQWPFLVHAQQPLTILSLSDSDEVWLTETAQVIEVSTAAIYQAICEHKDDKLFHCSNQFSAISGCRMSRG